MNVSKQTNIIDIALLGAGRIGRMHAANLLAHPRFKLRTVYDPDRAAVQSVIAGIDGVTIADSADEIFNQSDINAIFISSPTPTHCDLILQAAQNGLAVLCEKPLDVNLTRANKCRDQLARLGEKIPPIQLGFNRRFDPGHAALQARIVRGDIGKLEQLVVSSRDPAPSRLEHLRVSGGIFKDTMIHDFDLARFILHEEPETIFADGSVLIDPRIAELDSVDSAMAIMRTAGGVLCCINNSLRAVYGYDQRVEALGEKGMLLSDNHPQTSVKFFGKDVTAASDPLLYFFIERYADAYRLQLDSFADAIDGKHPPSPSFEDGRRALVLAEAAGKALREKRTVEVNF